MKKNNESVISNFIWGRMEKLIEKIKMKDEMFYKEKIGFKLIEDNMYLFIFILDIYIRN